MSEKLWGRLKWIQSPDYTKDTPPAGALRSPRGAGPSETVLDQVGWLWPHPDQGRLKRSSLPSWRLSELKLVSPDLCELKPPVSSGSPASCLILLRLLSAPRRSWLHRVSQHCRTPVPVSALVLSQQKHLTPRRITGCARHQERILRCLGFPRLRWGVNW